MSGIPTAAPKPGILVRAFLMVLPVGLAFMVPLSLWIYYKKTHQPEPAASQYAAMLRKDLSADDFARYVRILAQEIGERSLAKPDNLDAAAAFIESTLGYDNMGYAVQRQVFEAGGKPLVNLVAELPGKTKPQEEVLVLAAYDGDSADGIAALLCVAHALTGSEHARTIRFIAVVNAGAADANANGIVQWQNFASENAKVTRTLVSLVPDPASLPGRWEGVAVQPFGSKVREAVAAPLVVLHEMQSAIEQAADAP